MLDAGKVDDVFEYIRAQTNKIDPVLEQVQRPTFVDQLVESYIADIVLYMMEVLGPKRAEHFKTTHLQIRPPTPKTMSRYRSFDPYSTNTETYGNDQMKATSRNLNQV